MSTTSISHISAHRIAAIMTMAIAVELLCSSAAFAAGQTPMGYVICSVVSWFLYGDIGRGLSTLAVVVLGVGATLGKVSWGLAITVATGIAVMFGAPTIVALVTNIAMPVCSG